MRGRCKNLQQQLPNRTLARKAASMTCSLAWSQSGRTAAAWQRWCRRPSRAASSGDWAPATSSMIAAFSEKPAASVALSRYAPGMQELQPCCQYKQRPRRFRNSSRLRRSSSKTAAQGHDIADATGCGFAPDRIPVGVAHRLRAILHGTSAAAKAQLTAAAMQWSQTAVVLSSLSSMS